MMIKLKLIFSIIFAKRLHIVEYEGFTLCKIGSKNKADKGITKMKHQYPDKMQNNG